jgi:hypothetical protein
MNMNMEKFFLWKIKRIWKISNKILQILAFLEHSAISGSLMMTTHLWLCGCWSYSRFNRRPLKSLKKSRIVSSPSESRIFWSCIGVNCDHFQNIFLKWSKYIDIKFEYGISTHQINDYNYFNIFIFFCYLFLHICLIIYKLYCAILSQYCFSII